MLPVLDGLLRYVLGRDVFVSYSRVDASAYAGTLIEELTRARPKLSAYFDQHVAPPEPKLPASLRRHARWSSLFVLICTENAIESTHVKDELRAFLGTGRPIIPIDIDGCFAKLETTAPDLWERVKGAAPEKEERQSLAGTPSPRVVRRVLGSLSALMQATRIVVSLALAAVATAVIVTGAVVVSRHLLNAALAQVARNG